jgi:ElaB/YqjD/DUF883 family membrane-anchored ribosome-binding protein
MVDTYRPDAGSSAFDKAAVIGERVVDKAADVRDEAAKFATDTSARVQEAGRRAGDAVHATADYFRDQDFAHMVDDVKDYTRTHPVQALVGAAALGFLAAVLIRRT